MGQTHRVLGLQSREFKEAWSKYTGNITQTLLEHFQ